MMDKVIRLANLIRTTENVELFNNFTNVVIYIRDFAGFTPDWDEEYNELDEEATSEILSLAKELGYTVEFSSMDI